MAQEPPHLNLQMALLDPKAFFAEPKDILTHPALSRDTKLALLRQWELDARNLSTAEYEGMGGGEESMLARVEQAINALLAGKSP